MEFLKGAKDFARNPLGIIALFISLIYGFASLLLNSSASKLTEAERWPLIIFIVIFPVMVLVTFYKLVTKHHGKLYAPSDFKDDKSFLRTLSPEEQEKKLDKEVKESLGEQILDGDAIEVESDSPSKPISNISEKVAHRREEHQRFREELKEIENSVISMISSEFQAKVERNLGIGDTDANFDALLLTNEGYTFLEVKILKSATPASMMLDRVLYNAVVADKFFESKFKLILAVVYYFDEDELLGVENFWQRKVSKCPADIELRFISKEKIKISYAN